MPDIGLWEIFKPYRVELRLRLRISYNMLRLKGRLKDTQPVSYPYLTRIQPVSDPYVYRYGLGTGRVWIGYTIGMTKP